MKLAQQVRIKQRVYLQVQQAAAKHNAIWHEDPKGHLALTNLRAIFRRKYA